MVRLPRFGRNTPNTTAQNSADEGHRTGSSASAGLGRKLALALGIGALAYLIVRRRGREDSALEQQLTDPFESDEPESDGLEDAQKIAINEPSSESDEGETGADEPAIDTSSESVSAAERSDAEIDERTETDVQEEPAEPGEMTIDEGVAEEVVDEETGETTEREGEDESQVEADDTTDTDEEGEPAETDG